MVPTMNAPIDQTDPYTRVLRAVAAGDRAALVALRDELGEMRCCDCSARLWELYRELHIALSAHDPATRLVGFWLDVSGDPEVDCFDSHRQAADEALLRGA